MEVFEGVNLSVCLATHFGKESWILAAVEIESRSRNEVRSIEVCGRGFILGVFDSIMLMEECLFIDEEC